jgi:hypothetical protein
MNKKVCASLGKRRPSHTGRNLDTWQYTKLADAYSGARRTAEPLI